MTIDPATCRCGHPVTDAYLCRDCTSALWSALTRYPETRAELETTRTRQAKISSSGGHADGIKLPWHNAASMALDVLNDTIWDLVTGAARHRVPSSENTQQQHWPHRGDAATWLAVRVDGIAGVAYLADLGHDFVGHDSRAWKVIDRPPELSYAGQCDICGTHLYAVVGQPLTTCPACNQTHDVAMRRAAMLKAAADRLVTAREASTALTTLELPVTGERIRQWVARRRLLVRGHTPDRHRLYRLGDIIDLLTRENTRTQRALVV